MRLIIQLRIINRISSYQYKKSSIWNGFLKSIIAQTLGIFLAINFLDTWVAMFNAASSRNWALFLGWGQLNPMSSCYKHRDGTRVGKFSIRARTELTYIHWERTHPSLRAVGFLVEDKIEETVRCVFNVSEACSQLRNKLSCLSPFLRFRTAIFRGFLLVFAPAKRSLVGVAHPRLAISLHFSNKPKETLRSKNLLSSKLGLSL